VTNQDPIKPAPIVTIPNVPVTRVVHSPDFYAIPRVAIIRGRQTKVALEGLGMTTPVQLLCALSGAFGISVDDMRSFGRSRTLAAMRSLAMATIREQCGLSYPELATLFNRNDHTTALSNVRRAPFYRETYPSLAAAERETISNRGAA
jgi:chromosomal replication initiation ATPase DnaA